MTTGEHPTDEAMSEYCRGDSAAAATRDMESHIADCAECRLQVVAIVRQQFQERRAGLLPPAKGFADLTPL